MCACGCVYITYNHVDFHVAMTDMNDSSLSALHVYPTCMCSAHGDFAFSHDGPHEIQVIVSSIECIKLVPLDRTVVSVESVSIRLICYTDM